MSSSITQYLLPPALTQVSGADIFKVDSIIYQRYLDLVMHRRHRRRIRFLVNKQKWLKILLKSMSTRRTRTSRRVTAGNIGWDPQPCFDKY